MKPKSFAEEAKAPVAELARLYDELLMTFEDTLAEFRRILSAEDVKE